MPFNHEDRKPGDRIRSADWNEVGREVVRLGADKVSRAGGDTIAGALTVRGDVSVGAQTQGAALRIVRGTEDGSVATHGAVVLESGVPTAPTLRLGLGADFSWLQGGVRQTLALNPRGGDVGVGTERPRSRLAVAGGMSVGAAYAAGQAAPASSLIVEGSLGVGTPAPEHRLEVKGGDNIALFQSSGTNAYLRVATAEGLGNRVELANRPGGRLALWVAGANDAVNVLRDGRTGIGTTDPQDRLEVRGALRILTDGNPIRFTSGWSSFTDGGANQAEISNDAGSYKKLMIVGNSSGGNVRRVGVWDELAVHGDLFVDRNLAVQGQATVQGQLNVNDVRVGASKTISSPGRLHITGDELLYVLNKQGMMIGKEWGGTGNLQVQGTIGTNGLPPTPRNPGWGGGIRTFDIEAEGTIWCAHDVLSRRADLAEYYACDAGVEPADVVCLDPERDALVRSARPHDALVLGVVSTAPGFVLNAELQGGDARPVALSGRVPCKVVDENGPIRRGDLLTTSSTPGHAMRAAPAADGTTRPGAIIGKALGSLDAGAGTIEIFVLLR